MYDSGEKIANIIEKYQLEISPGQMTYFLPKISTEYICPYCKVPMLKRRNRNTGSWVTEKSYVVYVGIYIQMVSGNVIVKIVKRG